MCGIFAYIGSNQEALKLLIDALRRLEYRGYDSAGVCIGGDNEFKIEKCSGKVQGLASATGDGTKHKGSIGIAHTRWATHGRPTVANAHPHLSSNEEIAVVHNGIIENYSVLKESLLKKGYTFRSDTDSEVLATAVEDLMGEMPDAPLHHIVASALETCVGTFGCVFMFKSRPDLLIGARRGSPLILGLTEDSENPSKTEYFLASDACAIVGHTRDVVYIQDGETVVVNKASYTVHDTRNLARKLKYTAGQNNSDAGVDNPVVKLEMNLEQIEKGGFAHFMLKEIHDQKTSLSNCLRGRLRKWTGEDQPVVQRGDSVVTPVLNGAKRKDAGITISLAGMEHKLAEGETVASRFLNARRIVFVACGTSWHSALIGEYLFEQLAMLNVEVEYASEFRYRKPLIDERDIIVGISQSGETADTLEALRLAKANGTCAFGLVNVVGSTIARETDAGMYIHAGPEVGVASTKAFTGQVLSLFTLALYLAHKKGVIPDMEFERLCSEVLALPDTVSSVVEKSKDRVKQLAKEVRLASNFLFLGRGLNFPVALEGALKLKEISYIHAEGYPAAEMKHGPIALIDQFMPVVFIAPRNDPTYIKIKANIEEVHARCGSLIILTDEGNDEFDRFSECVIHMPLVDQYLQPIVNIIPLQLLSYYVAQMRGCEIDQPRNLAKSVTVE